MHQRLTRPRLAALGVVLLAALTLGIASGAARSTAPGTRTVAADPGSSFSCPGSFGRPQAVTTPADPRIAASLAVLRRPAVPADLPDAQAQRNAMFGRGLHLADARLLRSESAGRAWLVPVDDVRPQPLPERCIARAPAALRPSLRRERRQLLAAPAQPGVMVLQDGRTEAGPSSASLALILTGRAFETNSCDGPSHDMLGLALLLPDGDAQPYLRFPDGHTVLGDLRDNAVTFLMPKPDRRSQLPSALGWTDVAGDAQSTPLPGGGFSLEHCAAPPRYVVSRPATGPGRVEAVAGGEVPDPTLDGLALEVHRTAERRCSTVGVATPTGLGRHAATACFGRAGVDHQRFVVDAQRAGRLGGRALLNGMTDPATVRWLEVETPGGSFVVHPSRSGAFFIAYPDAQPRGRRWRIRAALAGPAPIRFSGVREVTLPPTRAGLAPTGAAAKVNRLLASRMAVFRRPRSARDELPRRPGQAAFSRGDANPLLARRLGTGGGARFYAVPGDHDLCLVELAAHGGSSGCGLAAQAADPASPIAGVTIAGHGIRAYALLPDGIDHVTVERADGSLFRVAVRGNFFALRSGRSLHRISWRLPDGRRFSLPGLSHTAPRRARVAAATGRPHDATGEHLGRAIARRAVRDTAHLAGCTRVAQPGRAALRGGRPLASITRLLPVLATPSTAAQQHAALALLPRAVPGRLLPSTLRRIALGPRLEMVVYVEQGGPGSVRDPAGCGRARRTRAAQLAVGHRPAVGVWARWRLAELRDAIAGLQTLWVLDKSADRPSGMAGAGMPAVPGRPLHPGLVASSSNGHGGAVYVGIAGRRTTRVLIRARRPSSVRFPRSVGVVDGFYGFALPRGTGPVELRELTARGAVVRRIQARR